jgi:hypothetical protein
MTLHTRPAQHLPDLLGIKLDRVDAKAVTARLAIRSELLAPTDYQRVLALFRCTQLVLDTRRRTQRQNKTTA